MLLCGDAEKPESYIVLLGGERVRMVFSDNPYNVAVPGNVSGKGKKKHGDFVMASGEMSRERFTEFLTNVFGHCIGVSLDGAIHFQWIDHRHLRGMMDAGEAVYSELKNMIVWDKQAGDWVAFIAPRMSWRSCGMSEKPGMSIISALARQADLERISGGI